MRICPECSKEFDAVYKLYFHCRDYHPDVQFNFGEAKVGSKIIKWPMSVKKTD